MTMTKQTTELIDLGSSLGVYPHALDDAIAAVEDDRLTDALAALRLADEAAIALRIYVVKTLRAEGKTWAEVGSRLGMSPQAAHKAYSAGDPAVVSGGNNLTRTRGAKRR